MRVYVLFAHPSRDSFCRAALEAFLRGLQKSGHAYEVCDLYELGFAPTLDAAVAAGLELIHFHRFHRGPLIHPVARKRTSAMRTGAPKARGTAGVVDASRNGSSGRAWR